MLFFFKLPLLILLFFITSKAYSFTLLWNIPPRFPSGNITIKVNTTSCSSGVPESYTEIQTLLKEAADTYWNQIYSSSLNFKVEGTITVDNDINKIKEAANNFVAVGCDDLGTQGTYAAASLDCSKSNNICTNAKGYMVINHNTVNSPWKNADRNIKIAVLAHELGHTIGIGHSQKSYALMYFSTSNSDIQTYLSEDDADAATFLYPDDPALLGLGGDCGAVASTQPNPSYEKTFLYGLSPLIGLLFGAFLTLCTKRSYSFFRKHNS
ncbi:MAG: matrixin family metalloprotease [Bdellovibrionota bacterium]|nr:matrixin family metalloprotease [Bdellovibrionota bacterium]